MDFLVQAEVLKMYQESLLSTLNRVMLKSSCEFLRRLSIAKITRSLTCKIEEACLPLFTWENTVLVTGLRLCMLLSMKATYYFIVIIIILIV